MRRDLKDMEVVSLDRHSGNQFQTLGAAKRLMKIVIKSTLTYSTGEVFISTERKTLADVLPVTQL